MFTTYIGFHIFNGSEFNKDIIVNVPINLSPKTEKEVNVLINTHQYQCVTSILRDSLGVLSNEK